MCSFLATCVAVLCLHGSGICNRLVMFLEDSLLWIIGLFCAFYEVSD